MMKKLKYLLLAVLALLIASCMSDPLKESLVQDVCEEGLVKRTYNISFEESVATRSFLSESTPVWEVGEKVSVYDPIASTARIFTVDAVKNGTATISGAISDGDFAFSAVYPASCAGTWKSITEPSYSAPSAQVIPQDRDIASDALVSYAYTANPDNGITFKNMVSLIQFKTGRDDIEKFELKLGSSEEKCYTVTLASGNFQSGKTYYMTVDAGSYSAIKAVCTTDFDVSYTKNSSKTLNAKVNGQTRLGVVSDGTQKHINYTTFKSKDLPETLNGLDGYVEAKGLLEDETAQKIYNSSIVQGSLSSLKTKYIPSHDKTAHIVCLTSKSIDPDGKPVPCSTFIIYPEGTIKGVVLASHASTTKNSNCPTNDLQFEAGLCFKGYAVVMSDYYGFGASSDRPQAYLDADVTARGNIDALLSAKQYFSDNGIAVGSEIINFGYSQGAHSAMATVKYISEHPECGVSLTKTFVGGGPYDTELTYDSFLQGGYEETTAFVLITICSHIECNHLDVSYADVFQEPLRSNVSNWILSKSYSTGSILSKCGTTDINQILMPSIIGKTGDAYDKIVGAVRENSLVTGNWAPPSGSKIYIYHSSEDDMVPYANKTEMVNYLKAHGCTPVVDLDLVTVKKENVYTTILSKEWGICTLILKLVSIDKVTHMIGSGFFIADILLNRW